MNRRRTDAPDQFDELRAELGPFGLLVIALYPLLCLASVFLLTPAGRAWLAAIWSAP